ncbi:hypothetical protein ACFL6S_06460 [Candidatus Poribacteria bacterium]
MNIYKHTVVSFTVSTLLFLIFKKVQMSIACLLAGVLIDLDHVVDYYINHELRDRLAYLRHPRKLRKALSDDYSKYRPNYMLCKFLHSVELLIAVPILYILGIWNSIATGILVGFMTHMIADGLPMGHFGILSLIYKMKNGFPTAVDILKQRLSRVGRDVNKCQSCGVRGETVTYKRRSSYAGFARKDLSKVMILCPDCYDRIRDKKD